MSDTESDTVLHHAVRQERWDLVTELLKHRADGNDCDNQNIFSLHAAMGCANVPLDVVTKLMSSENINMPGSNGCTALQLVVRKKRWDLVPVLVGRGADVNMCDNLNEISLNAAVRQADVPQYVISHLISPQNINKQDSYGRTALHRALWGKRWRLVPDLIQHGADLNMPYQEKETPLHAAVIQPDVPLDVVTQLISPENINMQDEDGCTALHLVVRKKIWKLLPVLLQHSADVNVSDNNNGTPLHHAVKIPNVLVDVITQLISPQNINMRDVNGHTACHLLVKKKRWDLVSVLLQRGGSVNLCDNWNNTLLHEAVGQRDVPLDIITQLITPENINMTTIDGHTTLHLVVKNKRWHLWPLLAQHGADMNVCDSRNYTPLHDAVSQPHAPIDIITQLISPQNINVQDRDGRTPLHDHLVDNWDLVPILVQNGADVNLCDKQNNTPLLTALTHKGVSLDVVKQLITPKNISQRNNDGNTALRLVADRLDLVPVLIQCGAQFDFSDIIDIFTAKTFLPNYATCLIQHLPMPYHLSHVEFIFTEKKMDKLEVNNKEIVLQEKPPISVLCMVDIICHLLQQTCLVKAQSYRRLDDIHTSVDESIVSHITRKHAEFENTSETPAMLTKLCMMTIRQYLPCKTDENFSKLGLPPGLLSLVTLSSLAEELNLMWWQGKLD